MEDNQFNFKSALFKLAFFEPNIKDNNDNQIIDYFIVDCLSAYSPLMDCSSVEIVKYIKTTFNMDFDEAEVISGAERLEKKQYVIISESIEKHGSPRIKLIKEDKLLNHDKIKNLEESVITQWKEELKNKYSKYLNEDNVEKIIETFQSFLTKMLVRHGKETVATLYPQNPKIQEWLESINEELIKDLPTLGAELDIILQIEIPLFFKSDIKQRKEYLDNLFNSSFIWHLIQVDDTCSNYFKETTKGQILILDNNILYSLIGLHGPQMLNAIHNLLKYANDLEYKLIVTTKTLDEFYNSIIKSSEKSFEKVSYSKSIAETAVKVLDSSNFLVTYWNEFAKNGMTVEEFAIEKSNIKNILEAFHIEITNEYREEIEDSEELLNEESLLRESCGNGFSQSIIEHDAFHRILIKKLRQDYKFKYSEAIAWFLTHDSKLSAYAQHALKGNKALPFCLHTNEWIQINRPFLKRMESPKEFEESFHILVTQPFLRNILSKFKVNDVKEKLLHKLNKYKNMDSQLAFDIATDVHFLSTLTSENNEKQFEEKIESEIVEVNKNLKDENKEIYELYEQEQAESKETIGHLVKSIDEIKSELSDKNEKHDKLLQDVSELMSNLEKTKKKEEEAERKRKEEESKRKEAESQIDTISTQMKKQKIFIRWSIFIVIFGLGTLFIWFLSSYVNWTWLETNSNKNLLKLLANVLLLFSSLNISIPKHWIVWLGFIVTFCLAILKFAFT